MERVEGIEPSSSAWKAVALPLSYTRIAYSYLIFANTCQEALLKFSYP